MPGYSLHLGNALCLARRNLTGQPYSCQVISVTGFGLIIASGLNGYLEIAVRLTNNAGRLATMRRGMREEITQSLLFNAVMFGKNSPTACARCGLMEASAALRYNDNGREDQKMAKPGVFKGFRSLGGAGRAQPALSLQIVHAERASSVGQRNSPELALKRRRCLKDGSCRPSRDVDYNG